MFVVYDMCEQLELVDGMVVFVLQLCDGQVCFGVCVFDQYVVECDDFIGDCFEKCCMSCEWLCVVCIECVVCEFVCVVDVGLCCDVECWDVD